MLTFTSAWNRESCYIRENTGYIDKLALNQTEKGMTPDQAKDSLSSKPLVLWCKMMVKMSVQTVWRSDALSLHSLYFVGPCLQILKTKPGTNYILNIYNGSSELRIWRKRHISTLLIPV